MTFRTKVGHLCLQIRAARSVRPDVPATEGRSADARAGCGASRFSKNLRPPPKKCVGGGGGGGAGSGTCFCHLDGRFDSCMVLWLPPAHALRVLCGPMAFFLEGRACQGVLPALILPGLVEALLSAKQIGRSSCGDARSNSSVHCFSM